MILKHNFLILLNDLIEDNEDVRELVDPPHNQVARHQSTKPSNQKNK